MSKSMRTGGSLPAGQSKFDDQLSTYRLLENSSCYGGSDMHSLARLHRHAMHSVGRQDNV